MLDLHTAASANTQREEDGLLPEALSIVKDDEPIWKVLVLDKTGMSIVELRTSCGRLEGEDDTSFTHLEASHHSRCELRGAIMCSTAQN